MKHELIFYATPAGSLKETCDRYFDLLKTPTVAQTYPPHCTLTGFFHRDSFDVAAVLDDVAAVVSSESGSMTVPDGAVAIEALRVTDEWIGLEVTSAFLADVTAQFVSRHVTPLGADVLRPKSWLHLSLAYGVEDLSDAAELADRLFVPVPDGGWELGIWERVVGGSWHRHPVS